VILLTDSAETPEVNLRVRLMGKKPDGEKRSNHSPPYLFSAYGDLTYTGSLSESDVREVTVLTWQNTGHHEEAILTSNLPFLQLDLLRFEERISTQPEFSLVKHIYSVRFTSIPSSPFEGEILVVDPWDESRRQQVGVFGDVHGPFSVLPPRLVLCRTSSAEDGGRAILQVGHQGSGPAPVVEPEGGATNPLNVRPLASDETGTSRFEVRLGPVEGQKQEGMFRLIVRPSPESSERIVVPVKILNGCGR
jgi:hypothetical protein